jgi:hypothetical protein
MRNPDSCCHGCLLTLLMFSYLSLEREVFPNVIHTGPLHVCNAQAGSMNEMKCSKGQPGMDAATLYPLCHIPVCLLLR